ncbi:MAG TPA: hypothetical protein VJN48_09555 [Terriglobales bacterium]|nr:hypothetical protein [Terriglobales bacterium]
MRAFETPPWRTFQREAFDLRALFISLLTICLFSTFLAAQTAGPERKVVGHAIVSERDPSLRIELPQSAAYVGADRFVLYSIADCELHAFVESDAHKNIRRLYWVQFEAYLPSKPDLHHTYDSPRHTTIAGLDFYVDTWVRAADEKSTPGSDLEHIQALVRAKGYKLPAGMMSVRLVHLLDAAKRKELMVIYSENVAPTGFTAADLRPGGKAYHRWPTIEKGLIERAKENVQLVNRN